MLLQALLLSSSLLGAAPATRIAVLVDDPAPNAPATATIEATLQKLGYEVVAADTSEKMRKVVAPNELLGTRLPEGLSVFEADAVLAGAVSYGTPADVDGVKSQSVSMTVRVIDLGTGQAAATIQSEGVGVGAGGPTLVSKATEQAVNLLFEKRGLKGALANIGQSAGSVVLVVQGLPSREQLLELKSGLEQALAGAPVREVYFAKGLGKLVLGGSSSKKAMVGPDIADLLSQNHALALSVDEVANTRIVARYDRARTVRVHALVTEPKLSKADKKKAGELGKYLATQLATFEFAKASYQPGNLTRNAAIKRAKAIGADVVVEAELLGSGDSAALAIRVIDVATGKPILRQQKVLEKANADFDAASALLAQLQTELPEALVELRTPTAARPDVTPTAAK
ncbi:MAG: hypothetical protein IPG45_28710 [Deltaproteobacteria bacterium]|nr:hypothetical protein [Deltaproteobacteria bacterium]